MIFVPNRQDSIPSRNTITVYGNRPKMGIAFVTNWINAEKMLHLKKAECYSNLKNTIYIYVLP